MDLQQNEDTDDMRFYHLACLIMFQTNPTFADKSCDRVDVRITHVDELRHIRQFQQGLLVRLDLDPTAQEIDLSLEQVERVRVVAERRDIVFASHQDDIPQNLRRLIQDQGCVSY